MMTRMIVGRVLNQIGLPAPGVAVRVAHSSGRSVYEGQTDAEGAVSAAERYDADEGGFLTMTVLCPGAAVAVSRLVTKTVVAGSVSAAYQCMVIVPLPRKRAS